MSEPILADGDPTWVDREPFVGAPGPVETGGREIGKTLKPNKPSLPRPKRPNRPSLMPRLLKKIRPKKPSKK